MVLALENVLRDAKVSGLLSVLFPTLFKHLSPRFERARKTFESCRILMKEAIERHKTKNIEVDEDGDFIDAYIREIGSTTNQESSFNGKRYILQ